jgi:hypothetical protein
VNLIDVAEIVCYGHKKIAIFFVRNDCMLRSTHEDSKFLFVSDSLILVAAVMVKSRKSFGVSTTKFAGVKVWGYL